MSDTPLDRNVPAGILALAPYQPGMPIEELQRRLGVSHAIKLASNENPLGASPRVRERLAQGFDLARYPDGGGFALKARIAEYHGVDPAQITLGNGSNDILEFVSRVFLGPGRAAMYSAHAFAVYPIAAASQNAESVVVPALPADAKDAYGHDLDGFARMLRDDVAVIFIANPNNPTGTCVPAGAIAHFLTQVPEHVIVVLDEAYWDYQEVALRPDIDQLLRQYPNLVVTRTFSKVYGLASLRVGYGLSSPRVADLLNRVRQPFNNNMMALAAAEIALQDQDFVAEAVALNKREMTRMVAALSGMKLRTLPSQANFLAIDFGCDAAPIHQALLQQGVIVRPMASYAMPSFLRVSIGTEAENSRFLEALSTILSSESGISGKTPAQAC
jgi:histidinol-phosphate aminotransferase